jgi:hypothetical protein
MMKEILPTSWAPFRNFPSNLKKAVTSRSKWLMSIRHSAFVSGSSSRIDGRGPLASFIRTRDLGSPETIDDDTWCANWKTIE